jgi:hypothetical protein
MAKMSVVNVRLSISKLETSFDKALICGHLG